MKCKILAKDSAQQIYNLLTFEHPNPVVLTLSPGNYRTVCHIAVSAADGMVEISLFNNLATDPCKAVERFSLGQMKEYYGLS